ncbi:MAG TPA: PepSY-associated TM helix domain-containing protein [Bryobacteraceae bacterium]|nr:PepSY-associated TM helix domain-containing protein [Bryobacteraceae bacterium]
MKRLYLITRDLHLYFGLFISPLLLVFSVSVFFLIHALLPRSPQETSVRTVSGVAIPAGIELLTGRDQVNALRPLLDRLDVHGEINFVRRIARENRLEIPVMVPGTVTFVDLSLLSGSAKITRTANSAGAAAVYLHKMPGQHNAALRGNSAFMQVWKRLADGTVYMILFLSLSGIWLWAVLRAERRIGLILIAAGVFTFSGLVYALTR